MAKSPGHQQFPDHQVRETRLGGAVVSAEIDGQVIAESNDVIRVDEDKSPARYYFPRDAIRAARLTPTKTNTVCPFKGTASYYDLSLGHRHLTDAVWSYEDPYDEHRALQGRLAFYDDQYPEIQIRQHPAG
jgi:uncharacterized protein (DUF427 family)